MCLKGMVILMLLLGGNIIRMNEILKREVPADWGWVCLQCRHGNPDTVLRCEYCGKKYMESLNRGELPKGGCEKKLFQRAAFP